MSNKMNVSYRLTSGIAAIILLAAGLVGTSYALAISHIGVKNNTFETGDVCLDLNGGRPILYRETYDDTEWNLLLEPGMTVIRSFYIKNNSTCDVYYRIYMENISGNLSEILMLKIKNDNKVLFCGNPKEMTKQAFSASILAKGKTEYLTAEFYYPEGADNAGQGRELSFTLCADATQVPNNPGQRFE